MPLENVTDEVLSPSPREVIPDQQQVLESCIMPWILRQFKFNSKLRMTHWILKCDVNLTLLSI